MMEKPGASTPWIQVNQLLSPEERFEVHLPHWQGWLFAPKHSSQLAALLYLLHQAKVKVCVQGRGTECVPTFEHAVIVSARAFTQMIWHEQGIIEVGAGCSLSHLHQFLFERDQEIVLEEDLLISPKRSIAGLILSGKIASNRYRAESFLDHLVGIEFVTEEGSQVKWGGMHRSPCAGPALHQLIQGLQTFPGVIVKLILKTHSIPRSRLRLAWKFRQKELLWNQFHALKSFTTTWEYLDVVLSGQSTDQCFLFAQISGLPEEIEVFSQACPGYAMASQQGERLHLKSFLRQQNLKLYSVDKNHALSPGEYLWIQDGNSEAWWLTEKEDTREASPLLIWKQRLWDAMRS